MKKVVIFLMVAVFSVVNFSTLAQLITYELNEPFDDVVAPWGFIDQALEVTDSTNIKITTPILYGYNGKVFQSAISSTDGRRAIAKTDINWTPKTNGTDGYLYVEFDWQSGMPTSDYVGFIRFRDKNDVVFSIGTDGANAANVLHFGNLDPENQDV